MGWWRLTAWKQDTQGKDMDLTDTDRKHIADCVEEGYTSGEVVDGD